MKSFKNLGNFPVVSSLRVRTPAEALKDVADSEKQGCKGFLLHAELLDEKYRNADCITGIVSATDLPVMILDYRTEHNADDEKLNLLKKECVQRGATAVDLPMNSFDADCEKSLTGCPLQFASAKPKEVSVNPTATARQKQFVREIHALGGEVLMSAHVGTMLSCAQAVSLAKEMESRGADIVKIIVRAGTMSDVAEIFATETALKSQLSVPFLYQTCGVYGKFVRPTAWMFGSCMILCHNEYTALSNREKPLIADVKAIREKLS